MEPGMPPATSSGGGRGLHQLRESGKDIQQDVGGERADKLIQHWLQDALRHTRVIPTNQRRAISAGAAGRCSAESRAHHSDPLRPAGELVDLVTAEGRSAKNGWVVRGPVESERLPVGGPTGGEHVHVELQLGLALPAPATATSSGGQVGREREGIAAVMAADNRD